MNNDKGKRRLSHIHWLRLTDPEDKALRAMAAKERRPLSHMTRECIIREAKRQGIWQEEE
jgi:hypothetical protein